MVTCWHKKERNFSMMVLKITEGFLSILYMYLIYIFANKEKHLWGVFSFNGKQTGWQFKNPHRLVSIGIFKRKQHEALSNRESRKNNSDVAVSTIDTPLVALTS